MPVHELLIGLGDYRTLEVLEVCESAVYMLRGSERVMVMQEASRVLDLGREVVCIDLLGERITVPGARIAEANLSKHEILVKAI